MSIRTISVSPEFMSSKKKKNRNKTMKQNELCEPITINTTNIRKMLLEKLKQHKKSKKNIIDINTDSLKDEIYKQSDPPYGILKNGEKPTYRQFTLKQYKPPNKDIEPPVIQPVIQSMFQSVIPPVIPSVFPPVIPSVFPPVIPSFFPPVIPSVFPDIMDEDKPKLIEKTYFLGKNKKKIQ